MNDKLNITIRIANQPPIPLTIRREEEEIIRRAESTVNRLWTNWSEKFKASPGEVLAMVAFQFAKLYTVQSERVETVNNTLETLETNLDALLQKAGVDENRLPLEG